MTVPERCLRVFSRVNGRIHQCEEDQAALEARVQLLEDQVSELLRERRQLLEVRR